MLAESGAIIEYVIAKHGGGHLAVTADSPDYADYLYWFHFANASMMPSTMIDIIIAMVGGAEENDTVRALRVSCLCNTGTAGEHPNGNDQSDSERALSGPRR